MEFGVSLTLPLHLNRTQAANHSSRSWAILSISPGPSSLSLLGHPLYLSRAILSISPGPSSQSLSSCAPLPLCLLRGYASRNSSAFLSTFGLVDRLLGSVVLCFCRFPERVTNPTPSSSLNSNPVGSCFIRCHSSILRTFSGQGILRMRLRQLYMKFWTFLVVFFVFELVIRFK